MLIVIVRRLLVNLSVRTFSASAMVGLFLGVYFILGFPTSHLGLNPIEQRILGALFVGFGIASVIGGSLRLEVVRRIGNFALCLIWSYVLTYSVARGPSTLIPISLAIVLESISSYLIRFRRSSS